MKAHVYRAACRPAQPLPKFWRPKLEPARMATAKIVHNDLVGRLMTGTATRDDLWDWIETGFTYSQMMRMLAEDGVQFTEEAEHALAAQLNTYPSVCERLRRHGRVGLSGEEIAIARVAAGVMDDLIQMDRHGIAERAAHWSNEQMDKIRRSAAR